MGWAAAERRRRVGGLVGVRAPAAVCLRCRRAHVSRKCLRAYTSPVSTSVQR